MVYDLKNLVAKKLVGPKLNASLGNVIAWYQDSRHILAKFKQKDAPEILNSEQIIPSGLEFLQMMVKKPKTGHIKIY